MERRHTDGNSRFLSSEQTDKRVGQDPGKQHAGRHDPCRQFQCHRKYLMYTLQFSGSVIISYQRTDSLNDPIGRQVYKSLQFVINAKHQHIALGKSCQDPVKC